MRVLSAWVALLLSACGAAEKPAEVAKADTPGQLPISTSCGSTASATQLVSPVELSRKANGCTQAKASTSTEGTFKSNTDATCQASLTGKDPTCIEWYSGPQRAWAVWDANAKTAECYCAH